MNNTSCIKINEQMRSQSEGGVIDDKLTLAVDKPDEVES